MGYIISVHKSNAHKFPNELGKFLLTNPAIHIMINLMNKLLNFILTALNLLIHLPRNLKNNLMNFLRGQIPILINIKLGEYSIDGLLDGMLH